MLGREFWQKFGLLPNIRDLKFSLTGDTGGSGLKLCSIKSVQSWDDLSAHHQQALQRSIARHFKAIEGVQLGRTHLIEHTIELKEGANPVQSRNYRVSPYVQREMDKEWRDAPTWCHSAKRERMELSGIYDPQERRHATVRRQLPEA
jgi:hypothetical protein